MGLHRLLWRLLLIALWVSPTLGSLTAFAFELDLGADDGIRYSYPKTQSLKIDARKLGECLARATIELGQNYRSSSDGIQCKWFPEVPSYQRSPRFYPSMWEYLRAETGRRCDYATGNEEPLKQWMMSQPDNSVDIIAMYKKSLELNHGNIRAALVTIHTALRDSARYDNGSVRRSGRYHYASTPLEVQKLFNKVVDIRGDLSERGSGFHGDHKGSWYRLWGVLLGRLTLYTDESRRFQALGPRCLSAEPGRVSELIDRLASPLASTAIYSIEVFGKVGAEPDKYKFDFSINSSRVMEQFAASISDPSELNRLKPMGHDCSPDVYLVPR